MMRQSSLAAILGLAGLLAAGPAMAAENCQKSDFDGWLKAVAKDAAAQGVSQAAIEKGLGVARFDPAVVKKDRGQGVFSQTFLAVLRPHGRAVPGQAGAGLHQEIRRHLRSGSRSSSACRRR